MPTNAYSPPESTSRSDTLLLIAQAAHGELSAARRLFARLGPTIQGRAKRWLLRNPRLPASADARDLAQDVWLALLEDDARELRKWDPERGASLEGYVGMVSERELSNLRQRLLAARRSGTTLDLELDAELPASEPTPESLYARRSAALKLGDLLSAALPPRGQAMLRDLCAHEFAPEDVAQATGVSRQVVYNWQHRLRKLARELGGELRPSY